MSDEKKRIFIGNSQYEKYGEDYTKILASLLLKAGKNASGKLIKSLSTKVQYDAEQISLRISAERYLEYVDQGRRPGTYPPFEAIKKWTTLKGIPQSATWPIMQKIYKFGIKPTNVIDTSIRQFESIIKYKLEQDAAREIERKLYDDLIKELVKKYSKDV